MNKDLKFKAWIKEHKNWATDKIIEAHMSDVFSFSDFDREYFIPENCYLYDMTILQDTTVKDVKGEDIYFGYLVKNIRGSIYEITFENGSFGARKRTLDMREVSHFIPCCSITFENHKFEVIGNIFENEGLIK
jgi:hypothetical protein